MGRRPDQGNPNQDLGGTWPATPDRDGSHAPVFNPKAPGQDGGSAPIPLDTTGGGAASDGLSIFNGILRFPTGAEPVGGS